MAKRTVIVDDLTGDPGARTRALRFDGIDYEIDLTDTSFAELRTVLKPYLRAGRTVGGKPVAKRSASRKAAATSDSAAVRAWARGQHKHVTERGRVPAELRAAWQDAGSPR